MTFDFVGDDGRFSVEAGKYRLQAILDLKDKTSLSVTVLCHGSGAHLPVTAPQQITVYLSNKDSTVVRSVAAGIKGNTVVFDFHGCGDSTGEEHWCYGGYQGEVDDLKHIVRYLRGNGVELEAIVGHSRGANVVLLFAALCHDDQVKHVVAIAPRFDMLKGSKERFGAKLDELDSVGYFEVYDKKNDMNRRITKAGLQARQKTDMTVVRRISQKAKVLLIHGSADTVVDPQDSNSLMDCLPHGTGELHVVPDATHNFFDTDNPTPGQELVRRVRDFVAGT